MSAHQRKLQLDAFDLSQHAVCFHMRPEKALAHDRHLKHHQARNTPFQCSAANATIGSIAANFCEMTRHPVSAGECAQTELHCRALGAACIAQDSRWPASAKFGVLKKSRHFARLDLHEEAA